MSDTLSEKDILEHAWKYFQLHANQRMSVFNFYISFSSLLTLPLILTLTKEKNFHLLGILFGFLLFLLSLVFWRLDKRTRMLIEISEDALKQIEMNFYKNNDKRKYKVRIFQSEEVITNNKKKRKGIFNNLLITYADCFNFVFFIFGLIGILFMMYHLYSVVLNPELLLNSTSFDIGNDTIKI